MKYNYKKADPKLWNIIDAENKRQDNDIDLIPSENYVSNAVRAANGSRLTNKYSEGYPHHHFYGGCQYYTDIELLTQHRVKKLFSTPKAKVEYVNVQPYSGTEANLEVYAALLKPGDSILSMSLDAGGHLSHGSAMSQSGHMYNVHNYGVDKNGYIDYNQVAKLAKKYQPKLIICGASSYPRLIDWSKFRKIADSVHAYLMADIAHISGLIAGQAIPSPVGYADVITTTCQKSLRASRKGLIMAKAKYGKAINHAVFPYLQGGPHFNSIGALCAGLFECLQPAFKTYAHQIIKNAKAMAKVFNKDDKVSLLTGGTDNHLMILDLRKTGMDGDELQNELEKVHITTNKEMIPNDPLPPSKASGLRLGTPAITTRGFKEQDAAEVAKLILEIIHNPHDPSTEKVVRDEVNELTAKHPIED